MSDGGKADFVLLIGTRSLFYKHQSGAHAIYSGLIQIRRRRRKELPKNEYRVYPILLSGSLEASFPEDTELRNTMLLPTF